MTAKENQQNDPEGENAPPEPEGPAPFPSSEIDSAPAENDAYGDIAGSRETELEAEVASLNDKLLRALAEMENVRRRADRDKEDTAKYAVANFAREMLGVADNLRRALDTIPADVRDKDETLKNLYVGVEMTERAMLGALDKFGVKRIDAMVQRFDHNLHEALFEIEDAAKPAGTVLQVLEAGYTIAGRLLRPAKVGISKGGPKAESRPDAKTEGEASADRSTKAHAYDKPGGSTGGTFDEQL